MDQTMREQALRRILWLLRPYLPHFIVIDGWVPHLYRYYGDFAEWRSQLSGTAEVDVLLADTKELANKAPLAELLRNAGFQSTNESCGAIWTNDPATGEKVEFFVPHVGIGMRAGTTQAIVGQVGLSAISLTDLELLAAHVHHIRIPFVVAGTSPVDVVVRVPSLGAYLVAKSATFFRRSGASPSDSASRRGKDVMYIRDVMAAGVHVTQQVERDLSELRALGTYAVGRLRYAASQLELLNDASTVLDDASRELAERDGMTLHAARLDVRGHAQDLLDLLRM